MFHASDFLAALADHIPHRKKHEVRYYRAASPKVRARLFGNIPAGVSVPRAEPAHIAAKGRRSWARLIWRVFEFDPLRCRCGELELRAIILDADSLARILAHAGLPTEAPITKPARAPLPRKVAPALGEAAELLGAATRGDLELASDWQDVDSIIPPWFTVN